MDGEVDVLGLDRAGVIDLGNIARLSWTKKVMISR